MRISLPGFRKRIRHNALSPRTGLKSLRGPSGVPSIGYRKFTGTESMPNARTAYASSITSSSVSPMPTMPPLHVESPACFTFRTVSTRSSYVWVVQISG